jgi:hypothetical protein
MTFPFFPFKIHQATWSYGSKELEKAEGSFEVFQSQNTTK